MLIHKAAAWVLVFTNLSLPVTFASESHQAQMSVKPKTSTALAQTVPAETAEDVTNTDVGEPPSTSLEISLNTILVSSTPTISAPVVGKSRADEENERKMAEQQRVDAENKRIAAEKVKITARKEAQRIEYTSIPETPLISQPVQKQAYSVHIIGYSNEQCVIYVQRMRGDRAAHGYAGDLQPQGYEPRVGAVALERSVGHVSLVMAIDGEYLILHDTNWVKGSITERRVHKSTQRGYIY